MTTTAVRNDDLLRFALKLDGVASGALGLSALVLDVDHGLPRGLASGLGVSSWVTGSAFSCSARGPCGHWSRSW
ncbi:hypothetical protein [Saccharothrix yanglingensis]|uniref:hypothetical protein n=1 Tax=Saccharothrix yanglingensis TaxID=659496 RepID=UPI0027D1F092|nr:hypothetical protein [Saccharothrix yanglingensis]